MVKNLLSPIRHTPHLAFDRGKKIERGPGEARLCGEKILPGAKHRCGDFFVQTRRAWPFLPKRFKFALAKAKMNLNELSFFGVILGASRKG